MPGLRRKLLLAPLIVVGLNAIPIHAIEVRVAAANSEEMLFADDPKDWAKPKIIVAPVFPEEQLKLNASGRVDVDVALNNQGHVKTFRIAKSEPANPAFEKAVSEVINLWVFHGAIDRDCMPAESNGNVRVWFEVAEGKGKVSVSSQASGNKLVADTAASQLRKLEWLNKRAAMAAVNYPPEARRDNIQANLLAVAKIDAASGEVSDVAVTWIETTPVFAKERVISAFKSSVTQSLRVAKFAPQAGTSYKVCVPFAFKLG
jgi:TonB family protein